MFVELNDEKKRIINTERICGLSKSRGVIDICYDERYIEANYDDDEVCIKDWYKLKDLLKVTKL